MNLSMIAGPLVGALIGYCTNYIAVKMLFRPLKPVMIGNYTLPFTPGIIPKGKERLAKALGRAIGDTLLTKEDMMNALLTDNIKNQVVDGILDAITNAPSIKETMGSFMEEEQYIIIRGNVTDTFENKILDAIKDANLANLIVAEGTKAIKYKLSGGFMGMFVTDELLASIAEPIKETINQYINENGPIMVSGIVEKEVEQIENAPIGEMISNSSIDISEIRGAMEKAYIKIVEEQIGKIIEQINIAGLIEQKINEMDVLAVEQLTLSVMKKELDAVVNLGALIGFVIGIINVFV